MSQNTAKNVLPFPVDTETPPETFYVAPPTAPLLTMADWVPALDWVATFDTASAEVEWVVDDLFERGRSYAVYSKPKAGKSLLALEWAVQLAVRGVIVLYADFENTLADLVARLTAQGYGPGDLANLKYLSFPPLQPFDTAAGGAQLVELVQDHRAQVVIIDTVSRVIAGEENSADTFSNLYRHLFMPLKALGVTVIRLDHSGKDVERGQRGSSAKTADVDGVFQLTVDGKRVTLRREATRTGNGPDRIDLVRELDPLRHVSANGAAASETPVEQALDHRMPLLLRAVAEADQPPTRSLLTTTLRDQGVGLRNDTVPALLDVAWRRGFVTRTPGAGRRENFALTQAGRDFLLTVAGPGFLALPDAPNVVQMPGKKPGKTGEDTPTDHEASHAVPPSGQIGIAAGQKVDLPQIGDLPRSSPAALPPPSPAPLPTGEPGGEDPGAGWPA